MTRLRTATGYLVALLALIALPNLASAKDNSCNYFNTLTQGDYEFVVSSRPIFGSGIQIVNISARRNGRELSQIMADMDGLAQTAVLTDMDNDTVPELAITFNLPNSRNAAAIGIFTLDGDQLVRVWVPKLSDEYLPGYKGRDSYRLEKDHLARTFPVFASGDRKCCPSGGTKTVNYHLRAGALIANNAQDAPDSPATTTAAAIPDKPQAVTSASSTTNSASASLTVKRVTIGARSIEIRASDSLQTFKTSRLDNPARLVIDLPGASTSLAPNPIYISKYGVQRARVGMNDGYVRIVLDATKTFPQHTITPTAEGLRIDF